MKTYIAFTDKIFSRIVIACMGFMFILIFSNVVLRFIFSTGLPWGEELARYAFLWCTFLGAVLAVHENEHIGITGIRGRFGEKGDRILNLTATSLKMAIAALILVGSFEVLVANIGGKAPGSGAPVTIAFAAMVFGAAAMLAVFTLGLATMLSRKTGRD